MEVAGLVIGVLPLAITALSCYKTGLKMSDNVRKRKMHIQSLVRALKGYETILKLNVEWLLKSTNAFDDHNDQGLETLLQDVDVLEGIEEFLGKSGTESLGEILAEVREILEHIAEGVEGFLRISTKGPALDNLSVKSVREAKVRFRDGFRLALKKDIIDDYITKLKTATDIMMKMQSVRATIQWIDSKESSIGDRSRSTSGNKLIKSLSRIREYATQLHQAISCRWAQDCHSEHETKLYLEDRVNKKSAVSKRMNDIQFKVIFAHKELASSRSIYAESVIEIDTEESVHKNLREEAEEDSRTASKVKFVVSPAISSTQTVTNSSKVHNICLEICKAKYEHQFLLLYIHTQCELRHSHITPSKSNIQGSVDTITLQELLSQASTSFEHPIRRSPRASVELALILASTMLQLNMTPWFNRTWSKDGIHFLDHGSSPHQTSSLLPQIDITQPLTHTSFNSPQPPSNDPAYEPKNVMLEFGITLLELWHSTTIEQRFAGQEALLLSDSFVRMALASRWLEESENALLPFQYEVTARCLRCHFDGCTPIKPKWDDAEFLRGFAAGVVEPLYKAIRPSHC